MSLETVIPIQWLTAPEGSCSALPAGDINAWGQFLTAHMLATLASTFEGVIVSTTPPADHTRVWLKQDTSLRPIRFYSFASGYWLSLHPQVSGQTIIWTGALPDFTTFDGGDAAVLSDISGPMWEEVTDLRAKIPIGAGTLPSGLVLAVGDTAGEENHLLTLQEIPAHSHTTTFGYAPQTGATTDCLMRLPNPSYQVAFASDQTGGGLTHNNMPPYWTVYFLRRTTRRFYAETP